MRSGVSVEEALTEAKRLAADREFAGFDQCALEKAARLGLANGVFEESEDEGDSVVEEFYPEEDGTQTTGSVSTPTVTPSLVDKLDDQAKRLGADAA